LYLKHELGIKLSIDDFGVGYSSLSQLKNLPANEIKIDLSFVRNILQSRSDKAVVKTIIDLGKNLNFEIVAEGVETKTQFELLKHLGCDRFQGYFFSKPVPVDDFERLVLAHAHPDYSVANS
ncbi:MAG: EAL domain-containing protein, partial [Methylotenera sp.]